MKTISQVLSLVLVTVFSIDVSAEEWRSFFANSSELPNNSVHAVAHNGAEAWVGTYDGLAYYDGSNWTIYNTSNSGLPGNVVNALAVEAGGAVWIGTNEGLARFDGFLWNSYTMEDSDLPVNTVKSIAIDSQGNKWIGTWGGGLVKLYGTDWTVYNTSNSAIPHNGVYSLAVDENDKVWVGTFEEGLATFDGSNWELFNESNSPLPDNNIRAVSFDKEGVAWIGTNSGIARKEGNIWTIYNPSNTGFYFQQVYAIRYVESSDVIWFATNHGLLKHTGSDWFNLRVDNSGLTNNQILAMDVDDNSNIWLGTAGGGLNIYNEGQIVLDINDLEVLSDNLSVFPNPANSQVQVTWGNTVLDTDSKIELIDAQGRLVREIDLGEITDKTDIHIETATLTAGVYFCRLENKGEVATNKLVVYH